LWIRTFQVLFDDIEKQACLAAALNAANIADRKRESHSNGRLKL
jgi:hypothetical protein